MDRRRLAVGAALLVLLGFGVGWIVVSDVRERARDRSQRVLLDAITLVTALRVDAWKVDPERSAQIDAAWDARRPAYDEEMRTDLRRRLLAWVDFELAEHADAAQEMYAAGRVPTVVSDTAREARATLVEAFGEQGETWIEESVKGLREHAYRASPEVAGFDPELPDYRAIFARRATEWAPRARARIEILVRR